MCHQVCCPWGILGTLLPAAFLLCLWLPPALLEMQVYQEGIRPPKRVTVHCEQVLCSVWWEQPQTLGPMNPEDFTYQLDIQKQEGNESVSGNSLIDVPRSTGTVYSFFSEEPLVPHTVRVRGLNLKKGWWGAWSKPVEFGLPFAAYQDPIFNLAFNPDTMLLSWVCGRDATNFRCLMVHGDRSRLLLPKIGECQCRFNPTPLHRGVQLEVRANLHHREVRERLVYSNPGLGGSAARGFTCVVYNEDYVNCTWEKGPTAPEDVQYFLFLLDGEKNVEMECPQYMPDSGTHTGCHFPKPWNAPFQKYFLINGTSQSTKIQFFDTILMSKDIEYVKLLSTSFPTLNITHVICSPSFCTIQWEQRGPLATLFHLDYKYQLEIQRKQDLEPGSDHPLSKITIHGSRRNGYAFPTPQTQGQYTVRIRAANNLIPQWSAWSQPVEFEIPS